MSHRIGGLFTGLLLSVLMTGSAHAGALIDQLIIRYQHDVQARMTGAEPEVMARMVEQTVSLATGLQAKYKRSLAAKTGAHVLRLPYAMTVQQAEAYAQQVMQLPEIDYAEPDYWRYPLRETPDDPQFNRQWHLMSPEDFAGATNVVNAWDLTKGSRDIVVAVLDEGITNHADLRPNLVGGVAAESGYDMVADDAAGDGDGRDADPSNPGNSITAAEDSAWHGTHVGGIIAARPNNNKFIAGVGWNTRLLVVRILAESGGRLSDQVEGMLWAGGEQVTGTPLNTNPAHIINLSIGTDQFESCATTEQNAIDILRDRGVSVVAAAGNENRNTEGSAPANCAGVISVTGVMRDGARTPFANYGAINDIAAPADAIFSTFNSGEREPENDTVGSESGTSQAAPQVAGVLALMLAANDKLLDGTVIDKAALPDLLVAKLKQAARTFPAEITGSDNPQGCNNNQDTPCVCTTVTCGAGLLDARQAVLAVTTPPTAKPGNNRSNAAGSSVILDGSGSSDDVFGGKIVSYQWQQISGPEVVLTNADKAKAGFTAPTATRSATQLAFELTVTDDVGLQDSQQVVITVPGKGGGGSVPLAMLGLCVLLVYWRTMPAVRRV